jgi:NADPH:quinone reductase-like Zn-dependent oxidoreductase
MVFVRVGEEHAEALGAFMQQRGVLINASPIVRLVTIWMSAASSLRTSSATGRHFCSAKEPVSQRILVLGASGYIGQHLVQALSEQGYPVLAAAHMSTGCRSSISRA